MLVDQILEEVKFVTAFFRTSCTTNGMVAIVQARFSSSFLPVHCACYLFGICIDCTGVHKVLDSCWVSKVCL